ncbi:MAG: RNA methyltransferase [Acidobacteriota bacterium]
MITSRRNPRIQELRELRDSTQLRRRTGRVLLEGPRLLAEWLEQDGATEVVVASPRLDDRPGGPELRSRLEAAVNDGRLELLEASDSVLDAVTEARGHQGVVAVLTRAPVPGLPTAGEAPILVTWQLQDPGNLGSLLRSAEAAGAAAAVVAGSPDGAVTDPLSPRTLRASAGSALRLPLHEWRGEPAALVEGLDSAGFRCFACEARGGVAPEDADLTGAVALLLGAEVAGLPASMASSTRSLTWPLAGRVESLGVAAAGALTLFETARQRRRAAASTGN